MMTRGGAASTSMAFKPFTALPFLPSWGWTPAEARKKGYKVLHLNVNRHNSAAIRAYERNGFHKANEMVTDIGGGFVMDDYIMEIRL